MKRVLMFCVLVGACSADVVVSPDVDASPPCDATCSECYGLPNGWSCNVPQQGACLDGICVPGE